MSATNGARRKTHRSARGRGDVLLLDELHPVGDELRPPVEATGIHRAEPALHVRHDLVLGLADEQRQHEEGREHRDGAQHDLEPGRRDGGSSRPPLGSGHAGRLHAAAARAPGRSRGPRPAPWPRATPWRRGRRGRTTCAAACPRSRRAAGAGAGRVRCRRRSRRSRCRTSRGSRARARPRPGRPRSATAPAAPSGARVRSSTDLSAPGRAGVEQVAHDVEARRRRPRDRSRRRRSASRSTRSPPRGARAPCGDHSPKGTSRTSVTLTGPPSGGFGATAQRGGGGRHRRCRRACRHTCP